MRNKGIYSKNYEQREEFGEGDLTVRFIMDSASLATGINMPTTEAHALAETSFNIVTNGRDPDIWGVAAFNRSKKYKKRI